MLAEDFVNGEAEIGEGLRGHGLPAREPLNLLVRSRGGLSVHFDALTFEIDDPQFRNARTRVEGRLDGPIVAQRRIPHFDDQEDIFRPGM